MDTTSTPLLPSLRVGLVGHRHLQEADIPVIRERAGELFAAWRREYAQIIVFSSLAIGADSVLAEVALAQGARLVAVIPFAEYVNERDFTPEQAQAHARLRAQADTVELKHPGPRREAFMAGGRWIINHSDTVIAVWNGQPSPSLGGTADIVTYAREQAKDIVIIPVH